MDWFDLLDEQQIITWRRWLHQHPELGFEEYETSKYIEAALQSMENIEVVRPTATSVMGIIKGKSGGKTVALRADIDALPIEEEADVDFRSENKGAMHACGHDTHAAMLLGAASVLSQMTEKFAGTVKLIFQHAEEVTPGGAQEILKTGLLDDVDYIYGSHVMAQRKAGQVQMLSGPVMAAQNSFHLTIQGKGSHGSMPEASIDPITIGANIVTNINQIVSRNVGPFENVVISFGQFSSGDVFNVIPDKAFIEGTVRTNTTEIRPFIEERIRAIIDGICKAHGATYELNYVHGYPAVNNDEFCTDMARKVAKDILPAGEYGDGIRMMGSEDFSRYLEKIPGTYVVIGSGTEEDGCGFVNHHPKFKVNEKALLNGTKMYVGFALEAMKQTS